MNVAIVDYGMGNLASVRRAFEECGANAALAERPEDIVGADRVVLPGVGAFGVGMRQLEAGGWPQALRGALENPRVALLGICLGMQLLAQKGHEGGETPGLGLVPGDVRLLRPARGERVPHVGWNEVSIRRGSRIFRGIAEGTDFYFVHSYHLCAAQPEQVAGTTPYCGGFLSAVENGNVWGVQFHPEKSSKPGFAVLRNFLAYEPA